MLLCLMLLQDFLVLKSVLRFFTFKTFTWTSICLVAVIIVFLVDLFVTAPTAQDSAIPSPMGPGDQQLNPKSFACEPIVFAMDSDGEIYLGKNAIGNVASLMDLTPRLKRALKERTSLLEYSRGMDLNDEVPLGCADQLVYIKTESNGNNARLEILIKHFGEIGVSPIQVNDKRKPQAALQ